MRDDVFDRTVQGIYAAAIAPARQLDTMREIGDMFGCHFIGSVVYPHDRSSRVGRAVGIDPAAHAAFLGRWHQANPFIERAPITRAGRILRTADVIPMVELSRMEIFADFYDPHRLHHGARLDLWHSRNTVASMALLRSRDRGDFLNDEMALAGRLMPHLQCATVVAAHLKHADLMVSAVWSSLDLMRQAVLLLDTDGRVLHLNRAADALLAARDGLDCAAGRLRGCDASLTAGIDAVIGRAVAPRHGPKVSGGIRLSRPSGAPDLSMVVVPLPAETSWTTSRTAAAIVCINDPSLDARLSPRILSELFGLTPAESALATRLLNGDDLGQVANRSGRSIATMRTHLARLMAKTRTKRQAELTRLLAAIANVRD